MTFLPELLLVASIHLLAVMSPGPDFVMISRNSLLYSRKVGIYSAIGLGLGIAIHVTYSLIGIGFIISKSIVLFSTIKLIGAGYLMYIGLMCLKAQATEQKELGEEQRQDMSALAAIKMGFLTNVLNPKATLFFLALFTQVINPATPKGVQAIYGVEMSVMTFIWFAFVAVLLSHRVVMRRFVSVSHYVERFFGVVLIGLGIKVAFSSAK